MRYFLVDASTGLDAVDGSDTPTIYTEEPTPAEGERVIEVLLQYPALMDYSPAGQGFFDRPAPALMPVGRFKLLLTQSERIGLRAAAKTDAVIEDFLDLLDGFPEGVSLSDPILMGAIGYVESAGYVAAGRAAQILAGQPPA